MAQDYHRYIYSAGRVAEGPETVPRWQLTSILVLMFYLNSIVIVTLKVARCTSNEPR